MIIVIEMLYVWMNEWMNKELLCLYILLLIFFYMVWYLIMSFSKYFLRVDNMVNVFYIFKLGIKVWNLVFW